MKWGVRNGPPYPLKPENHSTAEIKANPEIRRSLKRKSGADFDGDQKKRDPFKRMPSIIRKLRKGDDSKLRKQAKELSDEDLQDRINRMTREKQYIQLVKDLNPEQKKRESLVRRMVAKSLEDVGTKVVSKLLTKAWDSVVESKGHSELKISSDNKQKVVVAPKKNAEPKETPKPKETQKPKETSKKKS